MRTAPRQDLIWKEGVSEDPIDSMDIGSFVASDFGLDSISGDSVILATQILFQQKNIYMAMILKAKIMRNKNIITNISVIC